MRKVEPIKLKNTNWLEGGCEVGMVPIVVRWYQEDKDKQPG